MKSISFIRQTSICDFMKNLIFVARISPNCSRLLASMMAYATAIAFGLFSTIL
jgi:hypothetical protein